MEDSVPLFTLLDAVLFNGMVNQLHGPCGDDIGLDLGSRAIELYEAIQRRTTAAVESAGDVGDPLSPDEIDLAAIRVVSATVLKYADSYFGGPVGRTRAEVDELRSRASQALKRSNAGGRGSIAIWMGTFESASRAFSFETATR